MNIQPFLARLYVDADARTAFLADPKGAALAAGLSETDALALMRIDRAGLALAARSYAAKRAKSHKPRLSMLRRLIASIR